MKDAVFMMLFSSWFLFIICFFLLFLQTEPVPATHEPKQKSAEMGAAQFRKPDSSTKQGGLAAQFRNRNIHPAMSDKDSWKMAAQQRFKDNKMPSKHRQQSEDKKIIGIDRRKTSPKQLQFQQLLSNRTRDDLIFANLLQRCKGGGGGCGGMSCPQGNQWHRGELWKAWCLQSDKCIPKTGCQKLIKRIGGSDWDVCMDGINVAQGECLVYSVGVAGS